MPHSNKEAQTEKRWYTLKEAADYLHMEQSVLERKIRGHNLETRTLPGEKGEFLSRAVVMEFETMIRGPLYIREKQGDNTNA